ncbi:MAG TPA: hemolysin III family protein [Bdellovibrionales bacterium]|nr:hemolysin III family protein [Bdellovibrionales bacterium]
MQSQRSFPVKRRSEHSIPLLLKRTISAQLHLLGALIAFAGFVHLVSLTRDLSASHFWGIIAYGVPAVLVFSASAIFHFFVDGFDLHPKLESILRRADHFSISIFIAGCYTPVVVNVISPDRQILFLFAIWMTAAGVILYTHFKSLLPLWAQHRVTSTMLFASMGWLVTLYFNDFVRQLSQAQFMALILGFAAYILGAVVYALKKPKFFEGIFGFHEVWHVTVMVGFVCHYSMILDFYAR